MQAIIEAGGKHYRVSPGDVIRVEKLTGEVGSQVEFSKVLALFGDGGLVPPSSAKVTGTITGTGRGGKVLVFKFKRKKQYKRSQGHRQAFTEVKVNEILL